MHKALRRSLFLAGFGGLLCGAKVFTIYWDFPAAASELPEAIREYRSQGLPWTAADLERHVPDAENAAPLIRKAIAEMPDKKTVEGFKDGLTHGGAEKFLPAFEKPFAVFHQAVSFPKLDYHRDWDLGPDLPFTEFAPLKVLTRALVTRAEQEARYGNDAGALKSLEDGMRGARLTAQEPVFIAHLVAATEETSTFAGAERCLARAHVDMDRLRQYRRCLASVPPLPPVRNSISFETYNLVSFIRNLDHHGGMKSPNPLSDFDFLMNEEPVTEPPASSLRRDGIPPQTRAQAYLTRILQAWTELSRRTRSSGMNDEAYGQVAESIADRIDEQRGLSYRLNGTIVPRFSQAYKTPLAVLAAQRKAVALADALIKHGETGRWPERTDQIDPFSGKPLRMRFDGKRLRIWSIGRNGTDNGGLTWWEASDKGKYSDDLIAAYPPLPKPPRLAVGSPSMGD